MTEATNVPYVKRYHEVDGVKECGNPITKEQPYVNDGSNRRNRKALKERHRSNKKGVSLVVHSSMVPTEEGLVLMTSKVHRTFQRIQSKLVTHRGGHKVDEVFRKARTIFHYKLIR